MARQNANTDREDAAETVFYDAHCPMCRAAMRLISAEERPAGRFRCLPLGGDDFRALTSPAERAALPDSLVVRACDGRLLLRSTALTHILLRLGGGWGVLGGLLRLTPRRLRDWCYDVIARRRRKEAHLSPPSAPDDLVGR
jgi:predicted DCC family thiol-disulfide oxidoreductase YuxK